MFERGGPALLTHCGVPEGSWSPMSGVWGQITTPSHKMKIFLYDETTYGSNRQARPTL